MSEFRIIKIYITCFIRFSVELDDRHLRLRVGLEVLHHALGGDRPVLELLQLQRPVALERLAGLVGVLDLHRHPGLLVDPRLATTAGDSLINPNS